MTINFNNMKTIRFFTLITISAIVFASCGGKKQQGQESTIVETTEQTQTSVSSSTTSEITTQDWDSVLDQYEAFVDDYVEALNKAAKGDVSVYADMESLMEKAEKLGSELDAAQSSMSSVQVKRYMNIMTKMTNSAMDLSSVQTNQSITDYEEMTEKALEQYEEELENALDALDNLDW